MKSSFAGKGFHRALVLLALACIIGCSKKDQKPAAATPTSEPAAPATPAASAEAAPAPVANALSSADIQAQLAAAEAARRARQYEQAAKALLLLQQQRQLSEQQALAVRQQMRDFQRNLAGAVAGGDPQAKAAAEMLRGSAAHH